MPEKLNRIQNNESTEQKWAQKLSDYLSSEHFMDRLQEFSDKNRDHAIGLAAEYHILHPDGQGIDQYMEELSQMDLGFSASKEKHALVRSVIGRLGLQEP